jgi:hypothetical protein
MSPQTKERRTKVRSLPSLASRARRLLLVTGLVTAAATTVVPVQSAYATNETYSCSKCSAVSDVRQNWVTNVEGDNYSGKGICDNFTYSNETTHKFCNGSYSEECLLLEGEYYGVGWIQKYYEYEYHLAGRQDNFKGSERCLYLGSGGGRESASVYMPLGKTKAKHASHFAILSSRGKAHLAASANSNLPSGAVLAGAADGHELYAWQTAGNTKTCLIAIADAPGRVGGISCGPTSEVEKTGIVALELGSNAGMMALIPDGVDDMTVTDESGASHTVPASNNVAGFEDSSFTSISYRLSDGTTKTIPVSSRAVITMGPNQIWTLGTS